MVRITRSFSPPVSEEQRQHSSSSFLQRIIGSIRGSTNSEDGIPLDEAVAASPLPETSVSRVNTHATMSNSSISTPSISWYEVNKVDREKGIFVGNENDDNNEERDEEFCDTREAGGNEDCHNVAQEGNG